MIGKRMVLKSSGEFDRPITVRLVNGLEYIHVLDRIEWETLVTCVSSVPFVTMSSSRITFNWSSISINTSIVNGRKATTHGRRRPAIRPSNTSSRSVPFVNRSSPIRTFSPCTSMINTWATWTTIRDGHFSSLLDLIGHLDLYHGRSGIFIGLVLSSLQLWFNVILHWWVVNGVYCRVATKWVGENFTWWPRYVRIRSE